MKVLSLFDGISCGRVALERIGITPSVYYASEIEKSAIAITQHNWPDTIQLGDVRNVTQLVRNGGLKVGDIDLLIGGSPCQGFSKAGKNKGFDDPRSRLLFDYLEIKTLLKPKWFLLENVKMKLTDMAIVSALIGVEPVIIDSALVSGQRRVRAYWTNIPVGELADRGIRFADIVDWSVTDVCTPAWHRYFWNNYPTRIEKGFNVIAQDSVKSCTLTARMPDNWCGPIVRMSPATFRNATPLEYERLQTLPDNYTDLPNVTVNQRCTTIGNGWTVDVIAHILKGMGA